MDTKPQILRKIKTIYCGNWFHYYSLQRVEADSGVELSYQECLSRTTKKNSLEYDALTIVPLIKYAGSKTKKILLIAEFRPPVQSFVLELPAGLAEKSDILEDVSREMHEETGYTINKDRIYASPLITSSPDFYNITAKIITVEIDGDDPLNRNPRQNLEQEENIRIHLLDWNETFLEELKKLADSKNYLIHDKVYFLGLGLKY